jgi:hypothetical protein
MGDDGAVAARRHAPPAPSPAECLTYARNLEIKKTYKVMNDGSILLGQIEL